MIGYAKARRRSLKKPHAMARRVKARQTVDKTAVRQARQQNSLTRLVVSAVRLAPMMGSVLKFPVNALAIVRWKFSAKFAAANQSGIAPMTSASTWIGCRNAFRLMLTAGR